MTWNIEYGPAVLRNTERCLKKKKKKNVIHIILQSHTYNFPLLLSLSSFSIMFPNRKENDFILAHNRLMLTKIHIILHL